MTLKSNAMVAYPVHVVLLNATPSFRRWLIDNGHTLVGFLPVEFLPDDTYGDGDDEYCDADGDVSVVQLDDFITHTSNKTGRLLKLEMLHKSMKKILEPLRALLDRGFSVKDKSGHVWNCFPKMVSYCCDIPEAKDMSGVKHGTLGLAPCIRCMSSATDFESIISRPKRDISRTVEARKMIQDASLPSASSAVQDKALKVMKELYLSPVNSFLEHMYLHHRSLMLSDVYSIFTFESLHNLHLGTSKMLKSCFSEYLYTTDVITFPAGPRRKQRVMSSQRSNILKSFNAILAEIEKNYPATGLHVDFSKKEKSAQMNGFYLRDGVRGMLEGKNYRAVDMVFPFLAAFFDRAVGFSQDPSFTALNTMYTDIMVCVLHDYPRSGISSEDVEDLGNRVLQFKEAVIAFFGDYCDKGVFTLKFHLLDHMVDDLRRFGSLSVLDASAYEHFNTDIKSAVRRTSQRNQFRMDETVGVLSDPMSRVVGTTTDNPTPGPIQEGRQMRLEIEGCYLVRDGKVTTFLDLRKGTKQSGVEDGGSQGNTDTLSDILLLFTSDTLQVYGDLLHEYISCDNPNYHEGDIKLEFVQSGFVKGGFIPDLSDYNRAKNYISLDKMQSCLQYRQRIYGTTSFGPTKASRFSYVLMKGEQDGQEELWVAKVLCLFHISIGGRREECAFVQYMQCTPPVDEVDDLLRCVCLRWATDDGIDHTVLPVPSRGRPVVVGEWYGIEPMQSILGTVHVLRSNFAVAPFTSELPWSHHRFYINRFYRDLVGVSKQVND